MKIENMEKVEVYVMLGGDYCAFGEVSLDVVYDITNDVPIGHNGYSKEELENWEPDYSDVQIFDALKDGDIYYVKL